jgi:endonuclease G
VVWEDGGSNPASYPIQSQDECFSLANMMPQIPENNRGPWEGIESTVRKMARSTGDLYVVTGPIFQGENLQRIGGAVMVPTRMFKAIYDPRTKEAGAYLLENSADAQPRTVSIAELERSTGISIFPSVSSKIKSMPMNLAETTSYKERKRRGAY